MSPAAPDRPSQPVLVLILLSTATVHGGPAKGILQLIRHFPHPDVAFRFYNFRCGDGASADRFAHDARAAGVEVEFLHQHGRNYLSLLRQARRIVREREVDIVQSHGFKPAAICWWLKLVCRVRWVCFMHGTTSEDLKVRLYHLVESVAQSFADRVVLVSEAQRGRPLQRWSRRRTRVIHNAVDSAAPAARSDDGGHGVRAGLGLSAQTPLIAVVGRLSPEKGVDVMIDALAWMDKGVAAHVVVVGTGPQRADLAARAARLGLRDRVHFAGHTSTPGDYLMAADLVVLPSRSEGIPNVALEAMAFGRPLVATAVGGTPEVVVDGESGLLVPPDEPAALSRAIARVLGDAVLARALGRGGERRVAAEFSIAARCEKIFTLYAEIAPRPLAGGPAPRRTADMGDQRG